MLLSIVALHAILRLSEIPYPTTTSLAKYFYLPSLNFAAGKGFIEDTLFLNKSPELSKFLNSIPLIKPSNEVLSPFNSLHKFTDYEPQFKRTLYVESLGYRVLLGFMWKYFGFNWYFVGLLNYFFSLAALLSLMYCSYRILGITYSIVIGFIFSIATPEIYFIASFGRDGFPLWFASYLICALTLFVSKPLTFKRITGYTLLIGTLIYGSTQGRASAIYFLPLIIFIYFILFFYFQREKIDFKFSSWLKNSFLEKIFFFSLSACLTSFVVITLQQLTYSWLNVTPLAPFAHTAFLGLGTGKSAPALLRYSDGHTLYLGGEYAQRVFGIQADWSKKGLEWLEYFANPVQGRIPPANISFSWHDPEYGRILLSLYFSVIKTYPYFFIRHIFLYAFSMTFQFLGKPLYPVYGYSSIFYPYVVYAIEHSYLFVFSGIGAVLLYFRFNLKKAAFILVSFALFNAGVAFIQNNARHSLMGHPIYYFLSGVTIAFVIEYTFNFIRRIAKLASSPLPKPEVQVFPFLAKIKSLRVNYKVLLEPLSFAMVIVAIFSSVYLIKELAKAIEKNNIHKMQVFFDSLEKSPLEFEISPINEKIIIPSPSLYSKPIGIYCYIGHVINPIPIAITSFHPNDFYTTTIIPVPGEAVTVFFPASYDSLTVKFYDQNQCKSFSWADIKEWKGPLWEGSYDNAALK